MDRRYTIDTHTHTLMSGHAYHSLEEMIKTGVNKDLDILCITEHGPNMTESCSSVYFNNYRVLKQDNRLNKSIMEEFNSNMQVILGVEANILDYTGAIDIDFEDVFIEGMLDIVIASIHNCVFDDCFNIVKTHKGLIRAIENPNIHIIGHPDDREFDYNELVHAAKEHKKILELNNASNNPTGFRNGTRARDLKMLDLCKDLKVPISLGSDAHCKFDIGNFSYIIPILDEADFPDELIINSSKENFYKYINKTII